MAQKLISKLKDYQEIINRTPALIFVWRALPDEYRIEFVSENVQKLLGYKAEDFISGVVSWPDITHPDDAPRIEAELVQFREQGVYEFTQHYRLLTKSGEYRWFEDNTSAILDDDKNVIYYQAILIDVTERKKTEESLRENEAKFRTLFDLANDAIFLMDGEKIVDCNKKMLEMFRCPMEQLIGKTPYDLSPPVQPDGRDSREKIVEEIQSTLNREAQSFEWRHVRHDGTSFDAEVGLSLFKLKDQTLVQAIVRDITFRKRMEEELVRSKNLESIGTLAGGIAHDFNNLLMVILGNISLAKMRLNPGDKAIERLNEAERASVTAKELTQQLVTFSKGGEPWKKPLAIPSMIKSTTRFALSGSRVKCKYLIGDNLSQVHADEMQLRQAIHNIVSNAREAMPEGGTITMRAGNVTITQKEDIPLPSGDYIKISIEDKGSGIKEEHLSKVFDPYFTTKGMGAQKGMGLGLSVAYSIIKKHDGYISIESALGVGTTVHIYLPAYRKEAKAVGVEKGVPAKSRVLVMDDVEEVRQVTSNMLNELGYEVACAEDGREAVDMYKQAIELQVPFDAVILDLTIQGGMGGKEAFFELFNIDQNVKALIATGYTDDPVVDNFMEYGFKGAITKPYKMEELDETLKRIIQHG